MIPENDDREDEQALPSAPTKVERLAKPLCPHGECTYVTPSDGHGLVCSKCSHAPGYFTEAINTHIQDLAAETQVRAKLLGAQVDRPLRTPSAHRLSPGLLQELSSLAVDYVPGEPGYKGRGAPVEQTQWPEEAVRYSEADARATLALMDAQDEAARFERRRRIKQALLLLAVFVLGILLGSWLGHG